MSMYLKKIYKKVQVSSSPLLSLSPSIPSEANGYPEAHGLLLLLARHEGEIYYTEGVHNLNNYYISREFY